jgi:hypothetical protein
MTDRDTGETTRKYFKESEWTLKFRDQIEKAWSSELRRQGINQKTISTEQILAVSKLLADRFNIGGGDVIHIISIAD